MFQIKNLSIQMPKTYALKSVANGVFPEIWSSDPIMSHLEKLEKIAFLSFSYD